MRTALLAVSVVFAAFLLPLCPCLGQSVDPIELSRLTLKRADLLWKQGYVVAACREYVKASCAAPGWWYPVSAALKCPAPSPDATRLLEEAISRVPNPTTLHLAVASTLALKGESEQALLHMRAVRDAHQDDVAFQLRLADLLVAAGRGAAAMEVLTRSIERFPHVTSLLVRYARLAQLSGRLDLAEWAWRHLAWAGINPLRNLRQLSEFYDRLDCGPEHRTVSHYLARRRPLPADFRPSADCAKKLGTP